MSQHNYLHRNGINKKQADLKARNLGWFSSFCQSLVHPIYDDVVIYFLPVAQVLQYIQCISERVDRLRVNNEQELLNYWTTGSDHTHLHTQGKNITCWRGQDCLVVTWQPSVSQLSAFVRESHFLLLLFHWEFFFLSPKPYCLLWHKAYEV